MSSFRCASCVATVLIAIAIVPVGTTALGEERIQPRFVLSGDFRARLEGDWASETSAGIRRDDRLRTRVRGRIGLHARVTPAVTVAVRLRTGARASHQSPHVTVLDLTGHDTGSSGFAFDRWSVRAESGALWGWAGRDTLPFWRPNELFWDDDATVAGLAAGYRIGDLALIAGAFSLPVGMEEFAGRMYAAQIRLDRTFGSVELDAAFGRYKIEADPDDPEATLLLDGNGLRDYDVWVGALTLTFTAGRRPLTLGADLMRNTAEYEPGLEDRDRRTGGAVSLRWGSTDAPGDWQLGVTYARIGRLAVNASYAQDDWHRWGSPTETRASGFRGWELRAVTRLDDATTLVARYFRAAALVGPEDGNRARLDLDWKF